MGNYNALAVSKFILHTDVNKTLSMLRDKCRNELILKKARVGYVIVCAMSTIFIILGCIKTSLVLVLYAGLALCILVLCFYSMVNIRFNEITLSYKELKNIYNRTLYASFNSYDELLDDDSINILLPGARLMKIIYNYDIHHISVTKNGNLAFIFDRDNVQVSTSIHVDISKVQDASSKVNIIVDACYVRAIPVQ